MIQHNNEHNTFISTYQPLSSPRPCLPFAERKENEVEREGGGERERKKKKSSSSREEKEESSNTSRRRRDEDQGNIKREKRRLVLHPKFAQTSPKPSPRA